MYFKEFVEMSISGGSITSGTLSSGTFSGSSHGTRSFVSEGNMELQARMDLKRKRRKVSNRESAKRSRLRKQQHLDELTSQVNQLRMKKQQLVKTLNLTVQSYVVAEAQNSVLRTQAMQLGNRLCALREIICYMNNANIQQFAIPAAAPATYYPASMMTATTATAAGYDIFGANAWGSGMQMMQQQQQPIDLLYHC